MIHKLDLNLLRVFCALLDERSVTRAAERLHLSQSATSSALSRLRRSLDDPLFIHTSEGLVMSARADAMAETIRHSLTQIEEVTAVAATFSPAATRKTFRVRAPDHTLRALLPHLVPILQREAPSLQLEFEFLESDDYFRKMTIGELDILISYFSGKLGENLRATRLFAEEVVTIVARNHPKIRQQITLEQYVNAEHVVLRSQGTWHTSPVERALRKLGLGRKVKLTIPSHLIAPIIVESSDLIATVPNYLAPQFAKQHAIKVYPMPFQVPKFDFSMAWHERAHRDPAHKWLRRSIAMFCEGRKKGRTAGTD